LAFISYCIPLVYTGRQHGSKKELRLFYVIQKNLFTAVRFCKIVGLIFV